MWKHTELKVKLQEEVSKELRRTESVRVLRSQWEVGHRWFMSMDPFSLPPWPQQWKKWSVLLGFCVPAFNFRSNSTQREGKGQHVFWYSSVQQYWWKKKPTINLLHTNPKILCNQTYICPFFTEAMTRWHVHFKLLNVTEKGTQPKPVTPTTGQ